MGNHDGDSAHQYIGKHAKLQGNLEALKEILDLTFEDIYQTEEELKDEQQRHSSPRPSSPHRPGTR